MSTDPLKQINPSAPLCVSICDHSIVPKGWDQALVEPPPLLSFSPRRRKTSVQTSNNMDCASTLTTPMTAASQGTSESTGGTRSWAGENGRQRSDGSDSGVSSSSNSSASRLTPPGQRTPPSQVNSPPSLRLLAGDLSPPRYGPRLLRTNLAAFLTPPRLRAAIHESKPKPQCDNDNQGTTDGDIAGLTLSSKKLRCLVPAASVLPRPTSLLAGRNESNATVDAITRGAADQGDPFAEGNPGEKYNAVKNASPTGFGCSFPGADIREAEPDPKRNSSLSSEVEKKWTGELRADAVQYCSGQKKKSKGSGNDNQCTRSADHEREKGNGKRRGEGASYRGDYKESGSFGGAGAGGKGSDNHGGGEESGSRDDHGNNGFRDSNDGNNQGDKIEENQGHAIEEGIGTFLRLSELEFCEGAGILQDVPSDGVVPKRSIDVPNSEGGLQGHHTLSRHLSDFFKSPTSVDQSLSEVQTGIRLFDSRKTIAPEDHKSGAYFDPNVGICASDNTCLRYPPPPTQEAARPPLARLIPQFLPNDETQDTPTPENNELVLAVNREATAATRGAMPSKKLDVYTESKIEHEPTATSKVAKSSSYDRHDKPRDGSLGGGESEEEWLSHPHNSATTAARNNWAQVSGSCRTSIRAEQQKVVLSGGHGGGGFQNAPNEVITAIVADYKKDDMQMGKESGVKNVSSQCWAGLNEDGSWRSDIFRQAAGEAGAAEAERRRLAKISSDNSWRRSEALQSAGGAGCEGIQGIRRESNSFTRLQKGNVRLVSTSPPNYNPNPVVFIPSLDRVKDKLIFL